MTGVSASRLCPINTSFTLSHSLGEKAEEGLPTPEKDLPSAMNNCPEGANAYGSYCYYFVEDRLTWGEADVSEKRNMRRERYLKIESVNLF